VPEARKPDPADHQFHNADGIGIDGRGNMDVGDDNSTINVIGGDQSTVDKVIEMSPNGHTLAVWSGFEVPAALAVDAYTNIDVLDSWLNTLVKFSPNGKVLRERVGN